MARFSNFSMWRGRLPHWRADNEIYYVTFKHRRDLTSKELQFLYLQLMRTQRRRLDIILLVCLPGATELLFRVQEDPSGQPYELADVIEKAKRKAGSAIIKITEERWPPFYGESFDRIVRDQAELEELTARIYSSPETNELCEVAEEYEFLFSADLLQVYEEEESGVNPS